MDTLQLITNYIEAYNQFKIEDMLHYFSDDCIFTAFSAGKQTVVCHGKKELYQLATLTASYFLERKQTIKNTILIDNRAALEIKYEAIVKTDIPNGPKAGEKISFVGVSIFTCHDGKILKLSDYC